MPVASSTMTGVPVGTSAVKVEVAAFAAIVLVVFVEGTGVADDAGPVGAALVSVEAAVAAGAEVSVGGTVVLVEGAGVAGAEVPAGAVLVSVDAASVAGAEVLAVETLAGATEVDEVELSDGAEVPAGGLEVADEEVVPEVSGGFEAGGEAGAAGVLSSASALKGLTALTTNTNKTAVVRKYK